jgi:hypothetical protein
VALFAGGLRWRGIFGGGEGANGTV